jgi:hypothetical protein
MVLIDRLAVEVIKDFIALDPETQPRNVTAWTPVVTDVLRGSIEFEEDQVSLFSSHLFSNSSLRWGSSHLDGDRSQKEGMLIYSSSTTFQLSTPSLPIS